MDCNFTKIDDLDEELTCKTINVIDHLPYRDNKYRSLEPASKIHLVKTFHDFIMIIICLYNWNIKYVILLPTDPDPRCLFGLIQQEH